MRFGVIDYEGSTNLGDYNQSFGVKYIYKQMGISEDELIKINRKELNSYDGEYVVLPMAGYFNEMVDYSIFPLSKKIIPVFIGFHCTDEKVLNYLINYKEYAPFGCRDISTMNCIRNYDIQSFMSGCMSLCREKRKSDKDADTVYLVDVSNDFKRHIPKELLENSIEVSHIYHIDKDKSAEERALELNSMYMKNAKLVITSRLHCALPCVAMGIPVIVARNYNDDLDRYYGYEKMFGIYLPDEYENVDWNPKLSDEVEIIKGKIINNAIDMIRTTYNKYRYLCEVSEFFEEGIRYNYQSGDQRSYLTQYQKRQFFDNNTNERNFLSYVIGRNIADLHLVIWGAGDKGDYMMRRYKKYIKQFKSCIYVDKNKNNHGKRLNNYIILSPDVIEKYNKDNVVVIIAVNSNNNKAIYEIKKELVDKYEFYEGKQVFILDKLDLSGKMAIDESVLTSSLM